MLQFNCNFKVNMKSKWTQFTVTVHIPGFIVYGLFERKKRFAIFHQNVITCSAPEISLLFLFLIVYTEIIKFTAIVANNDGFIQRHCRWDTSR